MLLGFSWERAIKIVLILSSSGRQPGAAGNPHSGAVRAKRRQLAALLICVSAARAAIAFDEPAVNLGGSSFFDGFIPGPGWYFEQYFSYYTADRVNGNDGSALPVTPQHLDATTGVTALTWVSSRKVGSGSFGWGLALPYVIDGSAELGRSTPAVGTGMGDIFTGPLYQFDPVIGAEGPRFTQRVALNLIVPVGEYDRNSSLNPGSNFWSLNPYWAGTYWITAKWTASARLSYLWNAANTDPSAALGPSVSSTQAGQAVHGNFATAYQFAPWLHLGINGYWFRQITDSKVNSTQVSGREQVWAIGPGALFRLSPKDFIFANVYFEQDAHDRTQGDRYRLRYVHLF